MKNRDTSQESRRLKYIVNAPAFNPDSGGTIFMHELAHALNTLGEEAYLWPMEPVYKRGRLRGPLYRLLSWFRPTRYRTNPDLNTPLATKAELRGPDAVIIYPEIVLGNPMGIKNVVRWLLYKPGDQHPYEFTDNEMFFRVFEKADLPEITGGAPDLFLYKVNRTYRNENRPDRKGACYIVRKGHRKPRIAQTEASTAINIEGLTHAEINDVFNRCETFYSYDEATMYSQFAVVSGCESVVVAGEHESREDWARVNELGRYGIAYGLTPSERKHAHATRAQLIDLLKHKEEAGLETVRRFITLTKDRFTHDA